MFLIIPKAITGRQVEPEGIAHSDLLGKQNTVAAEVMAETSVTGEDLETETLHSAQGVIWQRVSGEQKHLGERFPLL